MAKSHYTMLQKAEIIQKETRISAKESFDLAEIINDMPFNDLKLLSDAIKIISKGYSI